MSTAVEESIVIMIELRNAISLTHIINQPYIYYCINGRWEFIYSHGVGTFVYSIDYRSKNRHQNLWDRPCFSSWWPDGCRYLLELCIDINLHSDVWLVGCSLVFICIEMFDWWERNDLWWPALSGHWLSCTGCCQYLLNMKCLIHGLLFLHLSTIDFLYIIFTNKPSIIRKRVSGFATDSPCSVWGHGWSTCRWWSSSRFMFLNNSWCVTLTE